MIQNPQNLGTLLRSAEAVGAHGVIIPQRRGAEVTQAVVNASSGASEHILIAQVVNLVSAITELKEHEVWVTGLDNLPEAVPLDQANLEARRRWWWATRAKACGVWYERVATFW